MKKELVLLNLFCVVAALGLLGFAVWNAIFSVDFLSTDNLFITAVFLVLALMFVANPLLYLKSEGKLPIPFMRRSNSGTAEWGAIRATPSGPALLDAKGRVVPPDVRSMVGRFTPSERKDD
jgi:hypothetical protein